MVNRSIMVFSIACVISGCGLIPPKNVELAPSRETTGKGEILSMPAQLRTVTVKNRIGAFVSCAEPGPDVALSDTFRLITGITSDISASANTGANQSTSAGRKASLNNDLQTSTTALELAGRTQTVLLARELLYRTCEAAANGWIDGAAVAKQQQDIISQIKDLIKTDSTKADTAKTNADTAKVKAEADAKLDAKLIGVGADAIRASIIKSCTEAFQQCITKPGIDNQGIAACQATVANCLK